MYTCLSCYDTFLFQPDPCPTCLARSQQKAKVKRASERRASYDPTRSISDPQFWQLLRWYPQCPCCGRSWAAIGSAICQDHIIPISQGGPNTTENLQPLCTPCNLWKSDRLIFFDKTHPGQVAALPVGLLQVLKTLPHYAPQDPDPQEQLALFPISVGIPHYPHATAEELEAETLQRCWAEILG